MESIFLHNNITIIFHSLLHVSLSYYIINPCLAFQHPLTSMTASHTLCHHLTPYIIIYW
ncbi:HN1_G0019220.mRNA.1.CDS.1 [Saccharomyces cerevisiae]|nr:HN1_G0019220.mRNA.1.CDS.1 [Saccharomyces cerevisiae]